MVINKTAYLIHLSIELRGRDRFRPPIFQQQERIAFQGLCNDVKVASYTSIQEMILQSWKSFAFVIDVSVNCFL